MLRERRRRTPASIFEYTYIHGSRSKSDSTFELIDHQMLREFLAPHLARPLQSGYTPRNQSQNHRTTCPPAHRHYSSNAVAIREPLTTMHDFSLPFRPQVTLLKTLIGVLTHEHVTFAGMRAHIPGSLPIRLSVVLGNLRMQRMLDTLVAPGDTVVDVGANIGYNTLYAAKRVGPSGRVYALEPAQDNLSILYANLFANDLRNVIVLPYAAGKSRAILHFYLRGDVSAVNSLYQDNFYHPVTQTVEVLSAPLDDLIPTTPSLVKIDVEGGEITVLQGMSRILRSPSLRLIVEWHPILQQEAKHAPDDLPRLLLDLGFFLQMVSHTHTATIQRADLPALTEQLLHRRAPVELIARR